jgi:hypothetical protein
MGSPFMDKLSKQRKMQECEALSFGGNEIPQFGESLGYDLARLLSDFPFNVLYYHPIELSMWK